MRKIIFRLLVGVVGAGTALLAGGCVERSVTIVSDPPGALAYVNDIEVGHTPVKVPFLWYGDYDIKLRLDADKGTPEHPEPVHYYLHTDKYAHAPWYQWIGPDLVAEIIPMDFHDDKLWAFEVPAVPAKSNEELVQEAKTLEGQLKNSRIAGK